VALVLGTHTVGLLDQTTTSLLVEFYLHSVLHGLLRVDGQGTTTPPHLIVSHLTHLFTSTAALSYRGRGISARTGLVPELSRSCCERALSGGPPMAVVISAWAILPRLRCSLHGAALRYLVGTIAAVLGPGRRLQTRRRGTVKGWRGMGGCAVGCRHLSSAR
jgi:hypothetical protein